MVNTCVISHRKKLRDWQAPDKGLWVSACFPECSWLCPLCTGLGVKVAATWLQVLWPSQLDKTVKRQKGTSSLGTSFLGEKSLFVDLSLKAHCPSSSRLELGRISTPESTVKK